MEDVSKVNGVGSLEKCLSLYLSAVETSVRSVKEPNSRLQQQWLCDYALHACKLQLCNYVDGVHYLHPDAYPSMLNIYCIKRLKQNLQQKSYSI